MTVVSWFLTEPRAARTAEAEPAGRPAVGRIVALLPGRPADRDLGPAAGLALARDARATVALVLCWRASGSASVAAGPALPAVPAARRLCRSLRGRDLAATAAGRLVRVDLPSEESQAARAIEHAVSAAAPETPVVIVLGGARGEALDALLPGADVVAVTGDAQDPRVRAALDGLRDLGVAAVPWDRPPGRLWRRIAHAGLGGGPAARLPRAVGA